LKQFPNATHCHFKFRPSIESTNEEELNASKKIIINHFKVSNLHFESDMSYLALLSEQEQHKFYQRDLEEVVIASYCVNLRRIKFSGFSELRTVKIKGP